MPFVSEKQRRYLWANEPEVARRWADEEKRKKKKRKPKLVMRKASLSRTTIAPIGGGSGPGDRTPPMPDFASLFAQPEAQKRQAQEAKQSLDRRRANWRDLNFGGIHGEVPDEPVLRYAPGETSTADVAVTNVHYLTAEQLRQNQERVQAGLDYGDIQGGKRRKKAK